MRDDRTYAVYTHRVVTEDNGPMYYVGVTTNVKRRWKPSEYNECSLSPYIEKYGWDNIKHSLVAEGLDREMALKLEDTLIQMFSAFQCCINQQRSGLISEDRNAYYRKLWVENKEYAERRLKYYRERRANDHEWVERQSKYRQLKRVNDLEWAEHERERVREWRSAPAGRIYDRVRAFNRRHPDRITESPLEARDNYLKYHIIPQYIKHDDL